MRLAIADQICQSKPVQIRQKRFHAAVQHIRQTAIGCENALIVFAKTFHHRQWFHVSHHRAHRNAVCRACQTQAAAFATNAVQKTTLNQCRYHFHQMAFGNIVSICNG